MALNYSTTAYNLLMCNFLLNDFHIYAVDTIGHPGKRDNATPLFDWGKYYEKEGRIVMPVSVQAHHSFVDGIHIGRFADGLQKYMDEY